MNIITPTEDSGMLIAGRWESGLGPRREIIEPAIGSPFAALRDATAAQAETAVAAARAAQPAWAAKAPLERAAFMRAVATLIRRDSEELARLIVREQGKPLKEARGEIAGTAAFLDYYAEFARRLPGEIVPSDHAGEEIWSRRSPIGVVAAIIPWNYPAALVTRKVAPALICGNTVVVKPHEDTPLSALALMRLFDEADVPPGVVNVVLGSGEVIGEVLSSSPDVDLITMTGSVPVGKRIMERAARNLTAISLELGGKAPFIVMADADLDLAARSAVTSRFMNCGQTCICNERTLVERSVYDEFVERFIAITRSLKFGNPLSGDTDLGPKVSLAELEKVERFVNAATSAGARAALGGARPKGAGFDHGFWFEPTVLLDVPMDAALLREEVFGPVVPIIAFDHFDDAVSMANDTRYGLSAYLFTNDFRRIMDGIERIKAGEIYINRPGPEGLQGYHTGWGDSGFGGDDGPHGIEAYLRKKTVYVNYSGRPTVPLMPY